MALPARIGKRSKEDVGVSCELLPGIPNDVTLDHISPKLPWSAFHVLSSVSRSWREAIQTKKVYEARVRANSTEPLIVYSRFNLQRRHVGLWVYSTRENCSHELPRIPWFPGGYKIGCKAVALDGKVYVLAEWGTSARCSSGEVYVLDLTMQSGWKQCASMVEARCLFACGAMDGKIYVFGGFGNESKSRRRSEVYDTQKNTWSLVAPLPGTRKRFKRQVRVETVGKELFVYEENRATLTIYDPAKNEWRLVKSFYKEDRPWPVFMKNKKLYSISHSGIDVYDVQQRSWIQRHTNCFATDAEYISPSRVLAVKDELFMVTRRSLVGVRPSQSFHCKGFDTEAKQIVWERMTIPDSDFEIHLKCSVEL